MGQARSATFLRARTSSEISPSSASSTSILFDEVIDLEHSIDPTIRGRETCGYMFHDLVLRELRKLKDGEGRYLWQSGANDGAPDLLNNRPYFVNQDMASEIASGNVTMLFGDLQQHKVRQVKGIRLYHLEERYKDTDEVGFMAFVRGDSILLNVANSPIKKLTQI